MQTPAQNPHAGKRAGYMLTASQERQASFIAAKAKSIKSTMKEIDYAFEGGSHKVFGICILSCSAMALHQDILLSFTAGSKVRTIIDRMNLV